MEFNGTFLATIASFILFVFLMNKVLYSPILDVMQQRKELVENNFKKSEDNKKKAELLVTQKQESLNKAKVEAKGKYNEVLNDYKEQKCDLINNAHAQAEESLEQASAELKRLSDEVKDGLKLRMTDLANAIVEKILGYKSEVQGFDNDTVSRVLWDK